MKNDPEQSAPGWTGLFPLVMRAGVPSLPLWHCGIDKMFEITQNTYPIKLGVIKRQIWSLSRARAVWGHAIAQPGYWSQRSPAPADPATESLAGFAVETVPIIQWAIWAPAANQSQGNWLRRSKIYTPTPALSASNYQRSSTRGKSQGIKAGRADFEECSNYAQPVFISSGSRALQGWIRVSGEPEISNVYSLF